MTKDEVEKFVRENRGASNDDEAFDTADFLLMDTPGLEEAIKEHYGVSDAQGWLANQI